jgi:hypothetical protein
VCGNATYDICRHFRAIKVHHGLPQLALGATTFGEVAWRRFLKLPCPCRLKGIPRATET